VTTSSAQLTTQEQGVVRRLLDWLRQDLGEDLLAVWLFGSRARGEADLGETDPDRRSDVDLMVVVAPPLDARAAEWRLRPALEAIADDEGDSPVFYSARVYAADHLRDRRRIRSFFVEEVDRDKVVLLGDRLEAGQWS
jgi:predicted nucleotidyltransferase